MPKTNESEIAVVQLPIAKVLPYAANAKIHPDAQVDKIAASLFRFGFVNPILVDAKGVVVAGHGRLMAAAKIGMKKVPVIKLGHLSDDEAKALRIADNSIAESGTSWNADMLEAELAALKAVSFDALEPLGLDSIELPDLGDQPVVLPPRANRNKTTIFLSVRNEDVQKARKVVVAALDKSGISHNL